MQRGISVTLTFSCALGLLAIVGGRPASAPVFEAIAQVGDCSGVLVDPRAILTSAHCVGGGIASLVIAGRRLPVIECLRHPQYQPGSSEHDIAICRLQARALTTPIALDDGPELAIDEPVSLAGFGLSGPFARGTTRVNVVDTSVVRVAAGHMEAGTGTATACRGDSGGPLLVVRGGTLRVAAIMHGTDGVICGSPVEVTPVRAHRAWLLKVLGRERSSVLGSRASVVRRTAVAFLAAGLGTAGVLVWKRRKRRSTERARGSRV
jgi:secreted trypsin-like serine protease